MSDLRRELREMAESWARHSVGLPSAQEELAENLRSFALAVARRVVEEAAKLPSDCNRCLAGEKPTFIGREGHFFHDVRICPNERLWYLLASLSENEEPRT